MSDAAFKVDISTKKFRNIGDELAETLNSTHLPSTRRPDKVKNLSVTSVTVNEIDVAWDQPSSGGKPTTYILQKWEYEHSKWLLIDKINSNKTTYCVTDLKPGTLYTIQVKASNNAGESFACDVSQRTKILAPDSPIDIQVHDVTSSSVTVEWSVRQGSSKPSDFEIKVKDFQSSNYLQVFSTYRNECFIHDLKPDHRYVFCIAAKNRGGTSSYVDKTHKTKPNATDSPIDIQVHDGTSSSVTVNWSVRHCSSKPTDFEIKVKDFQTSNYVQVYSTCGNECSINDLKPDHIYVFCIAAKNSGGTSSYVETPHKTKPKNMKADLAHFKLKGILNIGSTCYANCILQVLGQTPNLVPSLQYMVEQFSNIKKLPILSMLLAIFQKFDCDDGMYVDTRLIQDLTTEIHSIDPFFRRFRQNDCHSFLMCLFNVIQDEISSTQGELNNKTTKNPFEMFRGKMCNYFELPCNHSERTEDQVFTSLLIPIQETRTNEQWSIEKGLHLIMRSDEFDGEAFPCLKCQNKGLTSPDKKITRKTFGISEPPAILILQLGRFREVRGRLRKEDCDLTYETSLDIEVINHRTQIPACLKYELYSVVLHNGSIESGHYYSYVKSKTSGQWFNCSDRYVRNIQDPFEKGFSEAYLLFYRRLHY